MSKKLDELIKNLKAAKEALNKGDDISLDRVKEIMRNKLKDVPGKKIADHYRDIDETIPAKQRSNIKNSIKAQNAKTAPKPVNPLKVVKSETEIKKSAALDVADNLIKSLKGISSGTPVAKPQVPKVQVQIKKPDPMEKSDEEKSMDLLTKKFGAMMPKQNLQPTQAEFEAEMVRQGMAVTQEQAQELQKGYDGAINNWFAEAMKPISQRFKSEEEEQAYWDSLKINGAPDQGPGY